MALADKLAEMARYANEVQDLMDKEVELLEFGRKADANGAEILQAATRTGSPVLPHPQHAEALKAGGWWFCALQKDGGKLVAVPIAKFNPDLYFEAKPIERLWVEKTFEREQKKFTTEEQGDVIEWTPLTQEVTVLPNGRVDLGEFAAHFTQGAFANVGKAKGEASPILGVAPTASPNAFKVTDGQLVVPRLDKLVKASEARSFAAEWNEQRKMLLIYLEGVTLPAKA